MTHVAPHIALRTSYLGRVTLASDDDTWSSTGVAAVVEHHATVHDHGGDADRILKWIGERGAVGHRRRIEYYEIRGEPFFDQPAIRDVQLLRGEAAHLPDRLFQRQRVILAHVLAEHARERAEVARVRYAGSQRTARRERGTIRSDRDPRLLHGEREIAFVDDEPDTAHAAAVRNQHVEHEVVGVFPHLLRRFVHAFAFEALVAGVHPRAGGE